MAGFLARKQRKMAENRVKSRHAAAPRNWAMPTTIHAAQDQVMAQWPSRTCGTARARLS
jgi:hypothetical protein